MKKTIIFSLSLCFLCTTFSVFAQEYNKFDLNKYYTPDIVRNSLDLNFNSNGDFSNSNNLYTHNDNIISIDSTKASGLSGVLNSTFKLYKNTRNRVSTLQLIGSLNYNGSTNKQLNNFYLTDESNAFEYLRFNFSSSNYKTSNSFISFGIESNISFRSEKNNRESNSKFWNTIERNQTLNILPSISIGTGRIENVEDARQAIYLIDAFSKNGVLTRELSDDEIFRLSQQISRVKNKRFLDSRLHLMDEIASVDSFFLENKLIIKQDAVYFTNLYDLWLNGANFVRKSGKVLSVNFSPFGNFNNQYSLGKFYDVADNYEGTNKLINFGSNISFLFNYEKPVNLKWQHSVNASLIGSTDFQHSKYYESAIWNKFNRTSLILSGNYTLGFYPNSRTNLNVGVSEILQQNYSKYYKSFLRDSDDWYKSFATNTTLNFAAYYYISPQVRLSGNLNLNNNTTQSDNVNNKNLNAGFTAGVSYVFF